MPFFFRIGPQVNTWCFLRRVVAILGFCVLLAVAPGGVAAQGSNALTNPGFSDGLNGWNASAGWSAGCAPGYPGHSGDTCASNTSTSYVALWQPASVVNGNSVTLGTWAIISSGASYDLRLRVYSPDAVTLYVDTRCTALSSAWSYCSTDWTPTFSGDVRVELLGNVDANIGHHMSVDDVFFTAPPAPTPTNTVEPTSTPTNTPEPTSTNTPEPETTPTNTPAPTETPTVAPTVLLVTPVPTPTDTAVPVTSNDVLLGEIRDVQKSSMVWQVFSGVLAVALLGLIFLRGR